VEPLHDDLVDGAEPGQRGHPRVEPRDPPFEVPDVRTMSPTMAL